MQKKLHKKVTRVEKASSKTTEIFGGMVSDLTRHNEELAKTVELASSEIQKNEQIKHKAECLIEQNRKVIANITQICN